MSLILLKIQVYQIYLVLIFLVGLYYSINFYINLENDKLYLLDEPENSLSPKSQIELVKHIFELAKYCGCQFIIATHSPFLLALPTAKIYNLDGEPAAVSKFCELPNMRSYYELFHQFDSKFRK